MIGRCSGCNWTVLVGIRNRCRLDKPLSYVDLIDGRSSLRRTLPDLNPDALAWQHIKCPGPATSCRTENNYARALMRSPPFETIENWYALSFKRPS